MVPVLVAVTVIVIVFVAVTIIVFVAVVTVPGMSSGRPYIVIVLGVRSGQW